MQILALNFGTETLKYAVFARAPGPAICTGLLERISSVSEALEEVRRRVADTGPLAGVAHRVVHGGRRYTGSVHLDEEVEREIAANLHLAPQHNQLALDAVRTARRLWPQLPQVAVFDTAFHAAMPERAACYAVPVAWREAGVRRYGFHGLSHTSEPMPQRWAGAMRWRSPEV